MLETTTLCRISNQQSCKFRRPRWSYIREIFALVERYTTRLMFNLTETGYSTTINGNSFDAANKMTGEVCTQIYQWADQSIIKTHPDSAAYAIASNCVEPSDPDKPATPMANARSTDQQENLKRLMHQNLIKAKDR